MINVDPETYRRLVLISDIVQPDILRNDLLTIDILWEETS